MTTTRIKLLAIAFFAALLIALAIFHSAPATVKAATVDDPAATYKTKCAACHTATLSKFYDPAKTDEEHVQTILKGKKGDKPPFMPAFETKGMTEDEAKAMAAYMKTLKPPA